RRGSCPGPDHAPLTAAVERLDLRAQLGVDIWPLLGTPYHSCPPAKCWSPVADRCVSRTVPEPTGARPPAYLPRPLLAGRRRTIIGSVRLLFRVRRKAGLPHLVFG